MLAKDVMTRTVTTVGPETPIGEAIAKMVDSHISGLPVLDEHGKLVGILTEGDMLRRAELGTMKHRPGWLNFLRGPGAAAADYVRGRTMHVSDVMTPSPLSVEADTALEKIVAMMERSRIKRVPVLENGVLAGIVSRGDLVRALGVVMRRAYTEVRDDASIHADIVAEVARQEWGPLSNVNVTVNEGRVKLEGVAQTDAVRAALRVAAECVPGVIEVDNTVVVPDPMIMAVGA